MGIQRTARGRQILRLMLELDKPIDPRSEAELELDAQRNYRWNFIVNMIDGAAFWFGLSFISATTILPLFVSKLTTAPLWFALLAVLAQASWYLPQLFTAGATERLARKKPIVINVGFFTERLPIWLLPVAALLAPSQPVLALLVFFGAYAWHGFGAGMIAPAWSDMIARIFPVNRRGWFFGFSSFVGTGLGAAGAFVSGWILTTYPYPLNFAYTFLVAAVAITASWFSLALSREPVQPIPDHIRAKGDQSWHKLKIILRRDRNFRNFLNSRLLSNLGRMGAGFLTVAAIERWQVSDGSVGLFTAALLIGQTVGNLLAGLVADRHGHKVTLEIAQWAAIVTFGMAWLAPHPDWFYAVFFLMGVTNGIAIVSGVLVVMEFSQAEHRPTYVGIGNTVTGIGGAIAPLIGGLLAYFSYDLLFLASAVVSAMALLVLIFGMREPRRHSQADPFEEPAT